MAVKIPFNLKEWIDRNGELLRPPVSNKQIYLESDDYIVMIVGGPNARKDYHYNETEELFYQLEGTIKVHIQERGIKKTMQLDPGDMFFLPAKVPHSPERSAGSVGLVIECKRDTANMKDGLLWYCDNCNHKLHEVYFPLTNIEKDFLQHFKDYYGNEELRTCKSCSTVMPVDDRFVGKSPKEGE